jgi:hypothetical protein
MGWRGSGLLFLFLVKYFKCINLTPTLISQLDEDEKNAMVKIINSMLTKKRMKDLLDGKINLGH